MKEVLAIIPARSGSKRLPGKNTRLLAGKPLISYTFIAAKTAKTISRIVVVSDDNEVHALTLESELQFLTEPAALALDDIPMTSVIQWVLSHLEKVEGYKPLFVCLLQPTSPLRTADDIDAAVEVVTSNKADAVTSVCAGKENGAVYVVGRYLAINGLLYGPGLYRYEMPSERSIDIDTEADFQEAEIVIARGKIAKDFDLPPLIAGKTKEATADDYNRVLHQLARSGRSKGDGTRRPRGRPRKSK